MYSFEPNEEQKMLVDAISRYASSDLRPKAHEADEQHGDLSRHPQEIVTFFLRRHPLRAPAPL